MLRFRQKKIIAVFVLLSLSLNSFADTGLKDKTSTNLVELFKVKAHATAHIKGIEAKLLVTDEPDQEELLVGLAQSLLYFQDRHNQELDSKDSTSKGVSSLSPIGTRGKVSKVIRSKGPYLTNKIYRKALNAFKKASKLSLNKNRIKYTRELSELTVKLQSKDELVKVFDELLQNGGDESGTYLAHIDYVDGLAKFEDNAAETQFLSAISMRTPVDGVEAHYRYANYLLDNKKSQEALNILNKFSYEERGWYAHIALLRQKIMHQLKLDVQEVDDEMNEIRKRLGSSSFVVAIPKYIDIVKPVSTNILGLSTAHAFVFAHNHEADDSRGKYAGSWISTPIILISPRLVNAAEVVYNEARGERRIGRLAVAWAIRNRAIIDMNSCDYYPGAEGHPAVNACRAITPYGPSGSDSFSVDITKRYSCVVHGGTTKVGAVNNQMNDSHVSIENLISSGVLWEMTDVAYDSFPDPTGPKLFFPSSNYYDYDHYTGNPDGAQEWRNYNYCAKNNSCKVRLGNISSDFSDPKICPKDGGYSTGNFFWGRNSNLTTLKVDFK